MKFNLKNLEFLLEILDLVLGILDFILGILEFSTMSSSGLTRGSLYEILEFLNDITAKSPLGNSKFIYDEILGSSWGMTKTQVGG